MFEDPEDRAALGQPVGGAPNWTQAQVLAQLDTGEHWHSSLITYAFPGSAGGMYSQGEAAGFRAFNTSQQLTAVLALTLWDDLIAARFTPGNPGWSDIEYGYTSTDIDYAHAYYPDVGSVWLNVGEPDLVNPVVGDYGFMVFIHETGHALGLDHMGDYNGGGSWEPSSYQDTNVLSVMSYFGPRGASALYSGDVMQADWTAANGGTYAPQTPMLNDVMAIQAIYGTSTTTRLDNTVYGFASTIGGTTGAIYDFSRNRYPVLTIFDSGGTDTLNLSGWSSVARIDLKPGAFMSANEMTNNIAIAYTAVIENAVGGSGNDVISGNDGANRLEGGAGNDTLSGLGGDDTLQGGVGNDTIDGGTGTDTVVYDANFASYSITPSGNTLTIAGGSSGIDRITAVERFQFADGVRTLAELSPNADTVAPQLQSLAPTSNAAALDIGSNFTLTLTETVVAGNGNIEIHRADGTLWRSIDIKDTVQVRISGATVTIDPSANLPANASYYITIDAGALADLAGNSYAGIGAAQPWRFSTSGADARAPRVIALTPADDSTGAGVRGDLGLRFDEPVQAAAGNIVIQRDGTTVATISATDTARVTVAGEIVTINPAADLEPGADYTITIDAGAFRDSAGNAFAGLVPGAWNFATAAPIVGDDYPMSPDTPGSLALSGSQLVAQMDGPGDGDMFRVTLTAGVTYRFDMMGSSGLDPYLVLYGTAPNYALIAYDDNSGSDHDARLFFTPSASGVYYLAASDVAEASGAYGISAAMPADDYVGSTATSGRLAPTGSISFGNITARTDADYFALTLEAGAEVTLDLRSTGLANPFLRLLDGTGALLASDDDTGAELNAQITHTVAAAGTYYVAASDRDVGMGAYKLTALLRTHIDGSAAADTLTGSAGADTLAGGAGADRLGGAQGDDILQGGDGIDTATYGSAAARFTVQRRAADWVVTDSTSGASGEGRDLLYGIERLQFTDRGLALDLDGAAGSVAKILGAVFGPDSLRQHPEYVGIGLQLADGGMAYEPLLQLALDARLGPNPAPAALVDLLYTNLAGAAPTDAVRDQYVALLDAGTYTPLSLALLAAEHEINLANIGLVGLVETGLAFV